MDELLQVLDQELRLISPADEKSDGDDGSSAPEPSYQLAHDHLVPALRQWLTQRQRETRRGRAELLLRERVELWRHKPIKRHLPSLPETLAIWWRTDRRRWSEPERRMMRQAGRVHAVRTTAVAAAALLVVLVNQAVVEWNQSANLRQARQAKVDALFDSLLKSEVTEMPAVVSAMKPYRAELVPRLRQALPEYEKLSRQRLGISLALLPSDPLQADYLVEHILQGDISHLGTICAQLRRYAPEVETKFRKHWPAERSAGSPSVLRAVCALSLVFRWSSAREEKGISSRTKAAQAKVVSNTKALLQRVVEANRAAAHDTSSPSHGRWYHTTAGHMMIKIGHPSEFQRRFHPDLAYRLNNAWQRCRIGRVFAISATEVTVEQYARYLNEVGSAKELDLRPSAQTLPQTDISWFDAARYCRWLSEQEGIPESEMCFPPPEQIKPGMRLPKDYLQRTGYRLPTSLEWEYACRAGTRPTRPCGEAGDLLEHFAWYGKNSGAAKHTVASRIPNRYGLFDMLGNVWEWCADPPLPANTRPVIDDRVDTESIESDSSRRVMGGGYLAQTSLVTSSSWGAELKANSPAKDVGFRVVRTIRSDQDATAPRSP